MQNANGSRILVVDDESDILNLLEYNLKKAGFRILLARDGPEAIESARTNRPDLVILDIMLPNMEGTEVLRRLKSSDSTKSIPVIMLTAKGEEIDKVIGFELGAEDYITKPFSPRELILRVKAVLKRTSERPGGEDEGRVMTFNCLTVDLSKHKVSVEGRPVELSTTEFRLLSALMQAGGRVLSRDAILDRAWGRDCFVISRTVDTHVRRLRSKLGRAGDFIETVRGAGYRFKEE